LTSSNQVQQCDPQPTSAQSIANPLSTTQLWNLTTLINNWVPWFHLGNLSWNSLT
jgi:hypothetical protein